MMNLYASQQAHSIVRLSPAPSICLKTLICSLSMYIPEKSLRMQFVYVLISVCGCLLFVCVCVCVCVFVCMHVAVLFTNAIKLSIGCFLYSYFIKQPNNSLMTFVI